MISRNAAIIQVRARFYTGPGCGDQPYRNINVCRILKGSLGSDPFFPIHRHPKLLRRVRMCVPPLIGPSRWVVSRSTRMP